MSGPLTDEQLRELSDAEQALPDKVWIAYFTVHADPFVVTDIGRWKFTRICDVSTSPKDYGGANCKFIALARNQMPALLAEVIESRKQIANMKQIIEDALSGQKLKPAPDEDL